MRASFLDRVNGVTKELVEKDLAAQRAYLDFKRENVVALMIDSQYEDYVDEAAAEIMEETRQLKLREAELRRLIEPAQLILESESCKVSAHAIINQNHNLTSFQPGSRLCEPTISRRISRLSR